MAVRTVDLGSVIGPQGPAGAAGAPGPQGTAGKHAYQYAVEGGYTGTEAEFKAKLAKEYLPLSGGDMTGIIDMNNRVITGLPSPTAPSDAVNYHTLVELFLSTELRAQAEVSITGGATGTFSGAVSLQKVALYGTDVILEVSGQVSLAQGLGTVSDVKIILPTVFKMGSDWSNRGGYDGLCATYDGTTYSMSPYKESGAFWYRTTTTIGKQQKNESVGITGYIRVGVNA